MIADVTKPSGARVKRPKTAEEWLAYEGKPVWSEHDSGRPNTAILVRVIPPAQAEVHPSGHRGTIVTKLSKLRPWLKGEKEQEAIAAVHRARAESADPLIDDPDLEMNVIWDPNSGGFLGGVKRQRINLPGGRMGTGFEFMPGKAGLGHPLESASEFPRGMMAQLFAAGKKAGLLGDGAKYMNLTRAAVVWAEAQAKAGEEARALKLEAKRLRQEARAKKAAEGRTIQPVEPPPAEVSALPEPEVLSVPGQEAIPAIPSPAQPEPTPEQPKAQETPPVAPAAPPAAPKLTPYQQAMAERAAALMELAHAEALVLEAKGKLTLANARVEIARESP